MGNSQSTESVVAKAKESISNDAECLITLRFPGFQEGDKEFLENRLQLAKLFEKIPDLLDKVPATSGAGKIIKFLQSKFINSSEYYEKALAELKIDKKIVQSAHSIVMAKMSSIERQLRLYKDPRLEVEEKKTCLALADSECYQLLIMFSDPDFYLRKYPFVYAPFLVNFVAVYVPIAQASLRLTCTPQRLRDAEENMEKLKNLVVHFRDESISARVKYITTLHNPPIGSQVLVTACTLHYGLEFLLDAYTNTDKTPKMVYWSTVFLTFADLLQIKFQSESFRIISKWYRQQAIKVFEDYFAKPLKSIENCLTFIHIQLVLTEKRLKSHACTDGFTAAFAGTLQKLIET